MFSPTPEDGASIEWVKSPGENPDMYI